MKFYFNLSVAEGKFVIPPPPDQTKTAPPVNESK